MKNSSLIALYLFFVLFTFDLYAVEGDIKVYVQEHNAIYTSQKVTVAVELMTDAFSINDAKITFPSSPDYIVEAPQSAAYLRQEEIEGKEWQLVHYEYALYALRAGKIEIPSIAISFSASMGYGQPKKAFSFHSKSLSIKVKAPKGIKEKQFVLVSDNYVLEWEIKPESSQLIIGDALELTVTQKAKGVPDILLQPVIYPSSEYLRVYDTEPDLQSGIKGTFDVSRTDRFTFVAIAEGNVTIPAQTMLWWNPKSEKVEVENIAEISFEIIEDPQIAIDAKKAEQKQILIYLLLFLLFLFILYKTIYPYMKRCAVKCRKLYKTNREKRKNYALEETLNP
jgi:hypothetical protein